MATVTHAITSSKPTFAIEGPAAPPALDIRRNLNYYDRAINDLTDTDDVELTDIFESPDVQRNDVLFDSAEAIQKLDGTDELYHVDDTRKRIKWNTETAVVPDLIGGRGGYARHDTFHQSYLDQAYKLRGEYCNAVNTDSGDNDDEISNHNDDDDMHVPVCNVGGTIPTTLPNDTVEYLKAWMTSPEHVAHPYPTETENAKIMSDTGLELKQFTTPENGAELRGKHSNKPHGLTKQYKQLREECLGDTVGRTNAAKNTVSNDFKLTFAPDVPAVPAALFESPGVQINDESAEEASVLMLADEVIQTDEKVGLKRLFSDNAQSEFQDSLVGKDELYHFEELKLNAGTAVVPDVIGRGGYSTHDRFHQSYLDQKDKLQDEYCRIEAIVKRVKLNTGKGVTVLHVRSKTSVIAIATINELPDELLSRVLSFCGGGSYRFVAGTSRKFQDVYTELFPEKITFYNFENRESTTLCARVLQTNDKTNSKTSIDDLPNDLLTNVLSFVGDGSYRFVAGTSRKFRDVYTELFPKKQTYYSVSSQDVAKMCFQELKSKTGRIHLSYVASREGNLEVLVYLHFMNCPRDEWTTAAAAKNGRLDIVQWARANGCPWDIKTFNLAAKYGHVNVLEYAHSNQLKWKFSSICEIAASNGRLAVLQWARSTKRSAPFSLNMLSLAAEHGHMDVVRWGHEKGCSWDEWTCALAAKGGHLLLLKWLRDEGCPWNYKTCLYAANHGQLEILKWARENGCPWNKEICKAAAENGHIKVLEWLQAEGCPWDELTCAEAARNGHLKVLQFARSKGCPWNAATTTNAASNGHLEVLRWACENNCPCDYQICEIAAKNGNIEVLELATELGCPRSEHVCAYAARYGHLEILRHAHKNDFFWNSKTCANAAESGHLLLLKWAHEKGCPWDKATCENAAKMGHLEILQYAHQNGCPWGKETCIYAVENEHFELLMWACENGCPHDWKICAYFAEHGLLYLLQWAIAKGLPCDWRTCAKAAEHGHLEIVQWAHQNGCPWDWRTCAYAARKGHLEIVQWAHQNGCPWDSRTCANASKYKHYGILQWAIENGCPFDKSDRK